jgi:hypothetical protein
MIKKFDSDTHAQLIADKKTTGAHVILVWARTAPRIMTMIPVARALKAAGYRALLCISDTMQDDLDQSEIFEDVECIFITPREIKRLKVADVFISSETCVQDGPKTAVRIGIFHSLPDFKLDYDFLVSLERRLHIISEMDYFAISVCQPEDRWNVERYLEAVDRVFPAKALEKRRSHLTLLPFGYPKIDMLMTQSDLVDPPDTITYAPTRTSMTFSSVAQHGEKILSMLLETFGDHRIVFRPFPDDMAEIIDPIVARFQDNPRFVLDDSLTGHDAMMRSAVVVTDRSSMAMSFSLGLERPSVFIHVDGISGEDPKGYKKVAPVGFRAGSIAAGRKAIKRALRTADSIKLNIATKRANYIYNPGRATQNLAEIMPDILADRGRDEWLAIPRRPFVSDNPVALEQHMKKMEQRVSGRNLDKKLQKLRDAFAAEQDTIEK